MIEKIMPHAGLDENGIDTIRFDYLSSSYIDPCEEIDTCHYDCTVNIVLHHDDDNLSFVDTLIGQVQISYYNLMLMENKGLRISLGLLSDLFDTKRKQWLIDNFFNIDTAGDKDGCEIIHKNKKNWNLLIIDAFWLAPDWRGKGLAKYVINDICHHFWSTCEIIAVNAVPMQYEKNLDIRFPLFYEILITHPMETDFIKAEQKVFESLTKAGFIRKDNSKIFFIDLQERKEMRMNH